MADKWKDNPGHCPREAKGKRVRVLLNHGEEARYDDNPMSPPGWAADGKGGSKWDLDPDYPFAIKAYIVIE